MNKRYLWLAAALTVFFACGKTEIVPEIPEQTPEEVDDPWLFKDMSDRLQPGPAGFFTINADFGETRTHIEMNGTETYANTLWDKGDSFMMLGSDQSGWLYALFSTSQEGSHVEFTTPHTLASKPAPYFAVYPEVQGIGESSDGKRLLSVNIPSEQTAVPGGFSRGLAIAYTGTQSMTDELHFQSQVSLVRFRMTGDLVSQIHTVTLKGTSPLSGDAIIVVEDDGSGELTQDRSFSGDVHADNVSLSGNFEDGQDYYFVVVPSVQAGFQMIFADDAGHSLTKIASAFSFPRSGISDFGTIDLGDHFVEEEVDYSPVQYMKATATAHKPVTIAVIPDGFTEGEMLTYEMLARSGIDALMATEPFNSYRDYFNVWILKVASNESGANITDGSGTIITARDCYFKSMWGVDKYSDMTADQSIVFSFVTQNCPDIVNGTHTIQEVPVLIIINDTRYGGICRSWSDGRGYCMAPYTDAGGTLGWGYPGIEAASATASEGNTREVSNEEVLEMGVSIGTWRNTLVHEFGGHCFSRLSDEYWYDESDSEVNTISSHDWSVPYGLNISAKYNNPGWKTDLLGNDLSVLPSLVERDSRYSRIGVYQGGAVSMFNRWRSERVSCMIDNRFYFSTWQRMIIVKRIMTLSGSSFNATEFWAKDEPSDPLRDQVSGHTNGSHPLPVKMMPMLPPPVLRED